MLDKVTFLIVSLSFCVVFANFGHGSLKNVNVNGQIVQEKVINPNKYFQIKLWSSTRSKVKLPLGVKNHIRVDPENSPESSTDHGIIIEGFGDWSLDGEDVIYGHHHVKLVVLDHAECRREVFNQILGPTTSTGRGSGSVKLPEKIAIIKRISNLDAIPLEDFYVDQKSRKLTVEVKSAVCDHHRRGGKSLNKLRRRRGHESSETYLLGSGDDDNSLYDSEDYEDEEDEIIDDHDHTGVIQAYEKEISDLIDPSSTDTVLSRIVPVLPTPSLAQPSPSPSANPNINDFGKILLESSEINEIIPPESSSSHQHHPHNSQHHQINININPASVQPVISNSPNYHNDHGLKHDVNDNLIELGSGLEPSQFISPTPVLDLPPPSSPVILPPPTLPAPTFPKKKLLEKIAIYSGVLFNKSINTQDIFGLDDLVLTFDPATRPEWLTHLKNNTLFGLPTNDDVSEYEFKLLVNDTDELEVLISVRQRPKSRNYFYSVEIDYETGRDYFDVLEELERKVSDDIVYLQKNFRVPPYSLTFLVESHVSTSNCPVNELKALMEKVKKLKDSAKSFKMTEYKLDIPHDSICYEYQDKIIEQTGKKALSENFPPIITKQIDQLDLEYGVLFIHKLNDNFCYDPEDGYTRILKIELVNTDLSTLDNEWIQYDSKNQEIYALVMEPPMERTEFVLKCTDSEQLSANDAIIVKSSELELKYAAEFTLHFYTNGGRFDLTSKRKFIEILAKEFNDNFENLIFREIKESNGIVHVRWVNRTNPKDEQELSQLRKVFLSNEGGISKSFYNKFQPDFNISGGNLMPKMKLLAFDTPIHFDQNHNNKVDEESDDDEITIFGKDSDFMLDGDYLITYIIPSVLIIVMILLAMIIACLLSRTSSKAAATADTRGGFKEESTVFIKKGVPVIFQDEFDEEYVRESRSKSPAIFREERPPLPPDYHRTKSPLVTAVHHQDPMLSYHKPTPPTSDQNSPMGHHMSIHSSAPSSSRFHGQGGGPGHHPIGQRRLPPYVPP